MNLRLLVAVIAILFLSVTGMYAQNSNAIPLIVHAAAEADTIWFGAHTSGTFQVNASLDESEAPPPPVPGVHYWVWSDPSFDAAGGFGNGLFRYDMRGASSIDSFLIHYQPDSGFMMVFHFPGAAYINARYDSIGVWDPNGNYLFNMATVAGDSFRVPPKTVTTLKYNDMLIYVYGNKSMHDNVPPYQFVTGVRLESPMVPSGFSLQQNYPNPFNPTTSIRFDVAQQVDAEIAVFDVLGRKVATLASERLMPGTYSTVWNGVNDHGQAVTSGVYYVRMVAHGIGSKEDNFSAVRKVLLMK